MARPDIELTESERRRLVEERPVVVVSSFGPRGWPHSMPMWFTARDGEIWVWTFRKSQKVRNLERDPRATLLVEAGERYEELRGMMVESEAELVRAEADVLALGVEIGLRYGDDASRSEIEAAIALQASKRVAIRFRPVRTISWDHRKL